MQQDTIRPASPAAELRQIRDDIILVAEIADDVDVPPMLHVILMAWAERLQQVIASLEDQP